MAKTITDLYRADTEKRFRKIRIGEYPGDGALYPLFEDKQFFSKKLGRMDTRPRDLTVEAGVNGPDVLPNGGTSLHDVPGWFYAQDFWIPEGTEYSDELFIRPGKKQKICPKDPTLKGFHYQLEPRTRMMQVTFMGYLDNMARAAVVRQCALAKNT
jgi:hypothetical protein